MENQNNTPGTKNQLDPLEEKIRILRLSKTQDYYAKKLKRTKAAISQALSGQNPKLLARIARHSDWLDSKNSKSKKRMSVEN